MIITRKLNEDIFCLGASDWRNERFENLFPLPRGMSYNSYLIRDEKIAIIDTVDASVRREYIDNVAGLLDGATPDHLVINHMEPDHCACILELAERYPAMKLVASKKAFDFFAQFYGESFPERYIIAKNGSKLSLGNHCLHTIPMPMVHWPEVTATFDEYSGTLFSADAFGSFEPVTGNIYFDEIERREEYINEARRYYANIIGKYGPQVQFTLRKLRDLPLRTIAPLHGLIARDDDVDLLMNYYDKWSRYEPEQRGVLILFGSMYGNTERAAQFLAARLAEAGVRDICMHDISKTEHSYIIADCWRYSHLILAAPTYNFSLFPPMNEILNEFERLGLRNRRIAIIGNHTWSSAAVRIMQEKINALTEMTLIAEPHDIRSAATRQDEEALKELAHTIAVDL